MRYEEVKRDKRRRKEEGGGRAAGRCFHCEIVRVYARARVLYCSRCSAARLSRVSRQSASLSPSAVSGSRSRCSRACPDSRAGRKYRRYLLYAHASLIRCSSFSLPGTREELLRKFRTRASACFFPFGVRVAHTRACVRGFIIVAQGSLLRFFSLYLVWCVYCGLAGTCEVGFFVTNELRK